MLTDQSTSYAEPSIADYDERRGPLVAYWKSQNGQQSGDPAKLARALIPISEQVPPPQRFVAGADAIAGEGTSHERQPRKSTPHGHDYRRCRSVNMSVTSFHRQFRAVTGMSPLQYQKTLRLQEARRLMLTTMLDAGAAGRRVGYVSASQFSREYSRFFGSAPAKDVNRLRSEASTTADEPG